MMFSPNVTPSSDRSSDEEAQTLWNYFLRFHTNKSYVTFLVLERDDLFPSGLKSVQN